MEFELGTKLKCKVTGFTGVATARIEYLNGCIQYCIKPKVNKDGKIYEGEYIDVAQLEVVKPRVRRSLPAVSVSRGGPQADTPSDGYRG